MVERALEKARELGLSFQTWEEVEQWALTEGGSSLSSAPRVIPMAVAETEVASPLSAGGVIEVFVNENGVGAATLNPLKKVKVKIQWDKQNKHIPGSHNFIEGRSTITISRQRLEELVEKYMGTGESVGNSIPGTAGYKERIDFGEIIGECVYKENSGVIIKSQTTKGIIHYDNDGWIHLVPARS